MLASDANGIYVDPKGGNDVSGLGTQVSPVKTIMRAADLATTKGVKNLYLAVGTHKVTNPINEESHYTLLNLSIFGGFDPTDWSRTTLNEYALLSTIVKNENVGSNGELPALNISGTNTPMIVDGINFKGLTFGGTQKILVKNVEVDGLNRLMSSRTVEILSGEVTLLNVKISGGYQEALHDPDWDKPCYGVYIHGIYTKATILHSEIAGPNCYEDTHGCTSMPQPRLPLSTAGLIVEPMSIRKNQPSGPPLL